MKIFRFVMMMSHSMRKENNKLVTMRNKMIKIKINMKMVNQRMGNNNVS